MSLLEASLNPTMAQSGQTTSTLPPHLLLWGDLVHYGGSLTSDLSKLPPQAEDF